MSRNGCGCRDKATGLALERLAKGCCDDVRSFGVATRPWGHSVWESSLESLALRLNKALRIAGPVAKHRKKEENRIAS